MSDVIVTLSCPDQPGIVRAVSGFVADRGCTITESHQFIDREASRLYMRLAFRAVQGADPSIGLLTSDFAEVAASQRTRHQPLREVEHAFPPTDPRLAELVASTQGGVTCAS